MRTNCRSANEEEEEEEEVDASHEIHGCAELRDRRSSEKMPRTNYYYRSAERRRGGGRSHEIHARNFFMTIERARRCEQLIIRAAR